MLMPNAHQLGNDCKVTCSTDVWCHYHAAQSIMELHTRLRWQSGNVRINSDFRLTKDTSHLVLTGELSYGVYIARSLDKLYIITTYSTPSKLYALGSCFVTIWFGEGRFTTPGSFHWSNHWSKPVGQPRRTWPKCSWTTIQLQPNEVQWDLLNISWGIIRDNHRRWAFGELFFTEIDRWKQNVYWCLINSTPVILQTSISNDSDPPHGVVLHMNWLMSYGLRVQIHFWSWWCVSDNVAKEQKNIKYAHHFSKW